MSARRILATSVFAGITLFLVIVAHAETGTISGVVRGADGRPVVGVQITLDRELETSSILQTTTDKDGEYRFDGLFPGDYRVHAKLSGFLEATTEPIHLRATAMHSVVDIRLTPVPAGPPPALVEGTQPPLKFEAAGVRGLIDSGGYSAPAAAAAASGLVKGMADLNRADNRAEPLGGSPLPCSLEPELRKALESNADQAKANHELGLFYVQHNEPAKGIPYLERARQINSTDYRISHDLAVALLENHQFDSAGQLLTALAGQYPVAEIHELLARAEEGSGRFLQASKEYQIAAQADPKEEYLFGVGYELILAGAPKDAADAFEDGAKRFPKSVLLLLGYGTAEFLQGHTAEGLKVFLQASDLEPQDARPYAFLAAAAGTWGEESSRVRISLKRFWELAPDSADANYFYALGLLDGRAVNAGTEEPKIEALLTQAVKQNPDLTLAHFQLGALYADRGDTRGAMHEYEATVRLAPDMKQAHYRLARVYQQAGRTESAAREMELFKRARDQQTSSGISVEQFISVIDPPHTRSVSGTSCPLVAP